MSFRIGDLVEVAGSDDPAYFPKSLRKYNGKVGRVVRICRRHDGQYYVLSPPPKGTGFAWAEWHLKLATVSPPLPNNPSPSLSRGSSVMGRQPT